VFFSAVVGTVRHVRTVTVGFTRFCLPIQVGNSANFLKLDEKELEKNNISVLNRVGFLNLKN
jgi:hypothetical protein